jgi:hypothetical protein
MDDDVECVNYDLSEWTVEAQSTLVENLAEAGIEHSWEGLELVVSVDDEEVVDKLVAAVESAVDERVATVRTGEVEYDLVSWSDDDKRRLSTRLAGELVKFHWEESVLVVNAEFESVVDRIIDVDLLESD